MLCPAVACDGPPTWYWNGDACAPVECGTCEGTECASGFGSLDLCTSAHAGCDASLCRATGGTWKWWVEQCGHDICGAIPFADCEVGMPACNCGAYGTFQPGTGCVTDPSCPTPEPGTPEELCRWTGGTWGPFCCHSECGERCPDACVAPACDCGPRRVFDEGSGGCIEHARCWERRLGQRCDDTTRCEPGTLCCDYCGGPGCLGTPTCRPVVCGEPHLDMCGNCVDCP